jgi:hypothetical protein
MSAASGGSAIGRIIFDLHMLCSLDISASQAHPQWQYDCGDGADAGGAPPVQAAVDVAQPTSNSGQPVRPVIRGLQTWPARTGDPIAIIGDGQPCTGPDAARTDPHLTMGTERSARIDD